MRQKTAASDVPHNAVAFGSRPGRASVARDLRRPCIRKSSNRLARLSKDSSHQAESFLLLTIADSHESTRKINPSTGPSRHLSRESFLHTLIEKTHVYLERLCYHVHLSSADSLGSRVYLVNRLTIGLDQKGQFLLRHAERNTTLAYAGCDVMVNILPTRPATFSRRLYLRLNERHSSPPHKRRARETPQNDYCLHFGSFGHQESVRRCGYVAGDRRTKLGILTGSCDATCVCRGRQRSPFLAVEFFGRSTTAPGRNA